MLKKLLRIWKRARGQPAPVLRGRLPEKTAKFTLGAFGAAATEPVGNIAARVYRAATDTWEDLGVVSQARSERS